MSSCKTASNWNQGVQTHKQRCQSRVDECTGACLLRHSQCRPTLVHSGAPLALSVGRRTSVRAVWLRPRRMAACEKTAMTCQGCPSLRALNLQQQQCLPAADLSYREAGLPAMLGWKQGHPATSLQHRSWQHRWLAQLI